MRKVALVSEQHPSDDLSDVSPPPPPSDDEVFEGIGRVEVEFLGDRFVLGCVEGEEEQARVRAERFEIDTGEVLKAVSGELDRTRAMLMGAILAYERIEELEAETAPFPLSGRAMALDHGAPRYREASAALEALIVVVRDSNSYRESDPADQERRLAELEAGRTLLKSRWVSPETVKATLWGTLAYLASQFADAPIGEAATAAWTALKRLLHIG
jgi:cell division protein ZapA (FtsZ GTPase activity inhibitor)